MDICAQKNAVRGHRGPLDGAVVICPMVFVAMVPWMESAVQKV